MKIELEYQKWQGEISVVRELSDLIEKKYADLFLCVLAHGSVGSNEVIPYSDFDGLLIIRKKYKNSLVLAQFKKESMSLIYDFDPLQHHGWFEIYEDELQQYPQTYFPYELYPYSRLIFPKKNSTFEIRLKDTYPFREPFENLCRSLKRKVNLGFVPKNSYQLKSYLSEVMLLPALYIQACTGKAVYKKESFKLIETYFSMEILSPIETASQLRSKWERPRLNTVQKLLLKFAFTRKLMAKFFAPKIPNSLKIIDFKDFNTKLSVLLLQMEQKNETD